MGKWKYFSIGVECMDILPRKCIWYVLRQKHILLVVTYWFEGISSSLTHFLLLKCYRYKTKVYIVVELSLSNHTLRCSLFVIHQLLTYKELCDPFAKQHDHFYLPYEEHRGINMMISMQSTANLPRAVKQMPNVY